MSGGFMVGIESVIIEVKLTYSVTYIPIIFIISLAHLGHQDYKVHNKKDAL